MYIPELIKKEVIVETPVGEVQGKLICLSKQNRHLVLVSNGVWVVVKGWTVIKLLDNSDEKKR